MLKLGRYPPKKIQSSHLKPRGVFHTLETLVSILVHDKLGMVGHLFQNYDTIYVRFFATYTCDLSCFVGFFS